MKKLMTMIAAVATAFGLYTANADSHYYATSFEAGVDTGCTSDPLAFNLSDAGWTAGSTTETTLDLGAYKTGEGYDYAGNTGARRTFTGGAANSNYLKLETGSSTVGVLLDSTDIFVDQTVQFTGFEEVPAADAINGQIAIWASAIEADETADPAIAGDTNLYARVGTGTGYADVKIDIDDFDPTKWYRLTIKSIGNVFDAGLSQAGFLVYVNGQPATTSAKYNTLADSFNDTAKRYYGKGQLFTGIKTDSAAFTTVAFQGLGAIDDFVTSVEAPDFAAEVEFTVKAITGATIDKVVAMDDETEIQLTAPYSVMPGTTVKVYFKADTGYRLDKAVATETIEEAGEINVSDQIEVVEGFATLNGAIKGEAELADMMANLAANDTVAFLKEGVVTNGEEDVFYAFNKNTTIAVDANGDWTLTILNSAVETPSAFTIYTDIANNITAVFESGDQLSLNGANIAAGVTVDATDSNGAVSIDAAITVAGTLAATTLTPNDYITLDGAGAVWSAEQLPYEGDESIFTNEKVAEAGDAQSGYTYTIQSIPTTGFMVIIAGEPAYFELLQDAIDAASDGDTITAIGTLAQQKGIFIAPNTFQTSGLTIDLANQDYVVSKPGAGSAGTETQAFHIEAGNIVTIKDGQIKCPAEMKDYTWAADAAVADKGISRMINNYGELTLDNVDVDASNMAASFYRNKTTGERYAGNAWAVSGAGTGDLILTGGSSITAREAATGYASYAFDTDTGVSVTLNDATIYGDVQLAAGNLTLTKGTITGSLVAAANVGTVTKAEDFEITAPAGYMWDDNVLAKIVATVNGANYATAAKALAAVQAAEATGSVSVTALVDNLVVEGPDGQTITLMANDTIAVSAAGWEFGAAFTGNVKLAEGKTIIVKGTLAEGVVTAPEGFEVVVQANTPAAGYTTYSVAQKTFEVTFADGANSTISPAGTQSYAYGTALTITATADTGYKFDGVEGWTVVDEKTLTSNVTITATAAFKAPDAVAAQKPVVDPTKPTEVKAKDAEEAKAMVDIVAPEAAGELTAAQLTAYQGYFVKNATQKGDKFEVSIALSEEGAAQLAEDSKITAEAGDTTITLTPAKVVPGFFYGVAQNQTLESIKTTAPAKWTVATASGLETGALTVDKTDGATKEFFVIKVSPTGK